MVSCAAKIKLKNKGNLFSITYCPQLPACSTMLLTLDPYYLSLLSYACNHKPNAHLLAWEQIREHWLYCWVKAKANNLVKKNLKILFSPEFIICPNLGWQLILLVHRRKITKWPSVIHGKQRLQYLNSLNGEHG